MPPPMMTTSAWVGSAGAMPVRASGCCGWMARLCYAPARRTTGAAENRGRTPCPAEKAASGAVPERRSIARGLRRLCGIDGRTPCPAEEEDETADERGWTRIGELHVGATGRSPAVLRGR